jgi:23S rRNA pseudouridine2605 synthase
VNEAGERLQKVLARAGFASRRKAEELIEAGRVTVNGEFAALGRRVDVHHDRVEVDGVRVVVDDSLVHYLLHKPRGVMSTAKDPFGRPTVNDIVPAQPRVFSVGRLDLDTEGLLIMTNDGDLAHRLMHPSNGVEKEYWATVEGVPAPRTLRTLREGVALDDGTTAPAKVRIVDRHPGAAIVALTLREGRKRQVRRMLSAVGHPVTRLARVRIGPITDRSLAAGEWRTLTPREVRALDAATQPRDTRPRDTNRRAARPG